MVAVTVELRCRSAFSFGDGAVAPERLAEHAAALGYGTLGLVDAADLGGIVRFAVACQRTGVRPLVGSELLVDGRPLTLLVRTAVGYCNLAALITRARGGQLDRTEAARPGRGRPRLTATVLAEHAAGLTLLVGSEGLDTRRLTHWREVFGRDVAVELHDHRLGGDEMARNAAAIALAERAGVRWVVTQDARYIDRDSRLVHEMLTALRHRVTVAQLVERGLGYPNDQWGLLPVEQWRARWRGCDAGLRAAEDLAATCDFSLEWVRPPLPSFPLSPGQDNDTMLREQVFVGARERWGDQLQPRQRAQLEHELSVISRLGFAGFFLVMWDAVREAHRRGILAQGRGSAANSAVAYCLGITAVDPVAHGLLFERFLSEGRIGQQVDAPDIDVDMEHDRREEMLNYMYQRYDRSRAAITAVTQLYSGSTAVQDAMRALGEPAERAFRLSKALRRCDCDEAAERLRTDAALGRLLAPDSDEGVVIGRIVAACQDLPRLRSTHPGGFVLSRDPLGQHAPIEWTTRGRSIIQFDKDDLDLVGIPKFDFLGLGALAVVRRAFDAIEEHGGERPQLYAIPSDDAATYDLISRGETIGMFQIESRAQIVSLLHTRPERLYDIAVQVALIRPGPIQARFVRPYTERRRGREPVTYPDPRLRPILERTQGIPIFQEQAMAISMVMAGYTAAEADTLRRTMGNQRKRGRLLAALADLRERMVSTGVAPDVAAHITSDLESFANYGFPESHAWSFALIAYATAWLKAHHPAAFILGLLNAQPMGFYPVSTLIDDARRHGVVFRPPCLRDGAWDCTLERGDDPARPVVRIGWRFIRGMGAQAEAALTAARAERPFVSIVDVVRRARLDRASAVALARSGAMAAWQADPRRAAWQALAVRGDTLPLAPARHGTSVTLPPLSRVQQIVQDYAATGYSLRGHLMERWRPRLDRLGVENSAEVRRQRHRTTVVTAGLVIARQRPAAANGVTFLLLEDEHGLLNVIVPAAVTGPDREAVRHAMILLVRGRVEWDGPVLHLLGVQFRDAGVTVSGHRSRDYR